MVHTSDLNNPLLDTKYYLTWAATITQEFHNQFLAETAKGYPKTAMLEYKGLKAFYGSQIFFSGNILKPLTTVLDQKFGLDYSRKIDENCAEIKKLIEQCDEEGN